MFFKTKIISLVFQTFLKANNVYLHLKVRTNDEEVKDSTTKSSCEKLCTKDTSKETVDLNERRELEQKDVHEEKADSQEEAADSQEEVNIEPLISKRHKKAPKIKIRKYCACTDFDKVKL